MGENNYTLGLLVASCVALLAAVVLTTVEITNYKEVGRPMRAVAPASPAAAPAVEEGVEEDAAPSEEAVGETEAPAEDADEGGETPAEEAAAGG